MNLERDKKKSEMDLLRKSLKEAQDKPPEVIKKIEVRKRKVCNPF